MNSALKFLLALLVLSFALENSWATSFYNRPFPETVQDAPVIVRGKTGNQNADWARGKDGSRRLYTFYELQVDEVIKGNAKGPQLTIRELGGEKDGVGMVVAGAAQFQRGEDVVVMLGEKNEDGTYDVQGLMTGKFNIEQDKSGKEYLVGALPDEHDHGELGGQGGTPPDGKWTLEDLRKIVAAQAKGRPASPNPQNLGEVSTSVSPRPSPSGVVPQLQPVSPQGASESPQSETEVPSSNGSGWILWVAAALLAGGLGIWAVTRNRK